MVDIQDDVITPESHERAGTWRLREQRAGRGVVLAVAAVVAVCAWYAIDSLVNPPATVFKAISAYGPEAASASQLAAAATAVSHPVFWLGPRANTTYELTVSANGNTLVRYLPQGVPVGGAGQYATVASYPVPNAYNVTSTISGGDTVTLHLPRNGVGKYSSGNPSDIHLAYLGVDVQIEVYDPTPGEALMLVKSGRVEAAS